MSVFLFRAQIEDYNKELEAKRDGLKNGPVANRHVSDCLCCFIFLVAITGFFAASAYGYVKGDPAKLLLGWDSDGNGCGYTTGYEDYPYLYWPANPAADLVGKINDGDYSFSEALDLLKSGTCVKECPSSDKS